MAAHITRVPSGDDGSLFTTSTGLVRRPRVPRGLLTAAVSVLACRSGPPATTLRHHCASVLLAAGESVVAVAERLGHQNVTLGLKTYGHLMPDSEDCTRRAVDGAWWAPPCHRSSQQPADRQKRE